MIAGTARGSQILLLAGGGEIQSFHGYGVVALVTPADDLRLGGRFRLDVRPHGSAFVVLSGTPAGPPVQPVAAGGYPGPLDEITATDIACWDNLSLNPIGRHPTNSIPGIYWTPQFKTLSQSVGAVGQWSTLTEQTTEARNRWSVGTDVDWDSSVGDGVAFGNPDTSELGPGTNNIYFHTHNDIYDIFGFYKRALTMLYVTPSKTLYSCTEFKWGIYEILAAKIVTNHMIPWNDESNIEWGYNFKWVATHELGHALGVGHRPQKCWSPAPLGVEPYKNAYMVRDVSSGLDSHRRVLGNSPYTSPTLDKDDIDRVNRLYSASITDQIPDCP